MAKHTDKTKYLLAVNDLNNLTVSDPEQLSDDELLERCVQMGSIAVKSHRMFIGLLPLVARRRVYDVKKFSSIFHFALIVGGVSYEVASEVLRLDTQLTELPLLRRALYRGEIGWSKIRAALSLVTSRNEANWLELLKNISKPALEVYVRDYRRQCINERATLFPDSTTICLSGNSSTQSPLLLKNEENKAENFPGEITRLENNGGTSQSSAVGGSDENQRISSEKFDQQDHENTKFQDLSLRRETLHFPVSALLAARLRLYRQKMEKRLKKLVTWEDVLTILLENEAENEEKYNQ